MNDLNLILSAVIPDLTLPVHAVIVIFGLAAVLFAFLYLEEYRKHQELVRKLPTEAMERRAQARSWNLLHRAYRKAQAILGKAELDSIKTVAESRVSTKKIEAEYEAKLAGLTASLEKSLTTETDQAQSEFSKYLETLKTKSEEVQLLSQEFTKQKVNEFFEKFEANLSSFLTSTEQKSVMAIELELKAARQLIDTYKTQQLVLVDENIIAMLEKTLSLVLTKKLSLKEHLDLVYEALEKAKAEKFIT